MSEHGEAVIEPASAAELERDSALWSLYDAAFPAEEREPRSVTVTGLERGVVDVLRARTRGATSGFAVAHRLRDPAAAFLVYLAVMPEARGTGLGQALFQRVAASSPAGVVWEIDRADLARDAAEQQVRERRQRFFEHLGGRVVASNYLQPAINGPLPVPMALMACGAAVELSASTLIKAIYFEKYAALNGLAATQLESLLARRVAP